MNPGNSTGCRPAQLCLFHFRPLRLHLSPHFYCLTQLPPGNPSRRRDAFFRRCPSGRRLGAPSPLGLRPLPRPFPGCRRLGGRRLPLGAPHAGPGGWPTAASVLPGGGTPAGDGCPGGSASSRAARRAGQAAADRRPLEAELLPGSGGPCSPTGSGPRAPAQPHCPRLSSGRRAREEDGL